LLHVLKNSEAGERKHILRLIKRKNKNTAVVEELIQFVTEKGGLEFATEKMIEFKNKAIRTLGEFPESEARTSLVELMNYITTRKKIANSGLLTSNFPRTCTFFNPHIQVAQFIAGCFNNFH
jgi:octaprenyl-diphosphate synthase